MKRILAGTGTLAAILVAGGVSAATFTEIGDAGQTVATAQTVTDGTTSISGTLGFAGDVDLYRFSLASAALLVIDGLSWTQSLIDANMILFDGAGHGIEGDDDGGIGLESRISVNLGAGNYLLAFGENNISAFDTDGFDMLSNDSGYVGLTSGTLGYFTAYGSGSGAYTINFSQAVSGTEVSGVPLPAGLPLMLAGLGALGLVRRRGA